MATEIKLEALKENVDTVEVNAVNVSPGDVVAPGQALLEVQADKAALDVPAKVGGRVTQVTVKVGDQVKVGQTICLIEPGGPAEAGGNGAASAPAKRPEQSQAKPLEATKEPSAAERRAVQGAVAAPP